MFRPDLRPRRTAIAGAFAIGLAVAVSSVSIVRAEHPLSGSSVSYSCSSGTACVEGSSSGKKTWGVYGTATTADGVHGLTSTTKGNSGVAGISQGKHGSGQGVYGSSSNGNGVYGVSSWTTGAGVYGLATGDGWGVYGEAGTASSEPAAVAVADTANSALLDAVNNATHGFCFIDQNGNLSCSGSISGSVVQSRQRNTSGQHVLTYPSQSATATVEDVGTAQMHEGVANVQINPDFASVMDHNWYYVFLTPLGDTRGLYVSMKTATAFQVRENEHGRHSLEFDYRIVAHPLGAATDRLPAAPNTGKLAQLGSRR